MARTKFKNITIEYAGQDLLDGGMFAEVDGALNGSTRYTTQAVAHLGAAAVALDECGNLSREGSLSVAVDYDSEAEMMTDVLERQRFADEHQRGVLKYAVGGGAENARASVEVVNVPITGPEFGIEDSDGEWICGADWPGHMLTAENVQEYCEHVNAAPDVQGKAVLSWDGELLTVELVGEYAGAAGNGYRLAAGAMMPWADTPEFTGGSDGLEAGSEAALSEFSYSSTLGGTGLRVVYGYSFIVGGSAE